MATLTTSQIGADKQYTSAAAWESGEQRDLIAADEQETGIIDGGYDAGPVTVAGWGDTTTGTDATRYPKITSAVSHEGVFTADGGLSGYLSGKSIPNQNFTTLENVEVIQNDSDKAIEHTFTTTTFRLYNVLVDSPGTVADYAIRQTQNTAAADCRNCCIRSADGGIRFGDNLTTIVESTTVIAGGVGGNYAFFRGILTDCTGYNSVSGLAFRFPEVGSDYCAGSDTTTPGSNSVDNITTAVFENYAGGDYTPAAGELLDSAITPGANLSADFTDDITGYTRPSLPDPWCIGAYEIQGGVVPTPPTDVEAGGAYSGTVGTPISIDGASFTPGTGSPDVILWTFIGPGGTWDDDSILSPTFTPDSVDTYTLTLTVTNDTGNGADTASLTATAAGADSEVSGAVTAQVAEAAGSITAFATIDTSGAVTAQAATSAGDVTAESIRSVNINLTDEFGAPSANLTGLRWAFFDQAVPDLFLAPVDQGTGETTDALGNLSIDVASNLGPGGIGWLSVTDSDGTITQDPAHKAFAGPVEVS